MKKKMELTKEEMELIEKHRLEQDKNRPKLRGTLKHDLYYTSSSEITLDLMDLINEEHGYLLTNDSIKLISTKYLVEALKDMGYGLCVPKGTEFVCYIDDGEQLWYDDVGIGVEEMPKKWAEKHLINIEPI